MTGSGQSNKLPAFGPIYKRATTMWAWVFIPTFLVVAIVTRKEIIAKAASMDIHAAWAFAYVIAMSFVAPFIFGFMTALAAIFGRNSLPRDKNGDIPTVGLICATMPRNSFLNGWIHNWLKRKVEASDKERAAAPTGSKQPPAENKLPTSRKGYSIGKNRQSYD